MIAFGAVTAADNLAQRFFSYQPEPGKTDVWRSFADQAVAGQRWKGDCDDLASTALDLLVRAHPDVDQSLLFRLCVATPECERWVPYDHMVAAYINHLGNLVCFGDTFGVPARPRDRGYRVAQYSRLSEGIVWRQGSPLA